ncbi:MAG: hypothetical protein KAJ65_00880 [Gammaproteobacteria bacterium]|jgi:hypothetical protein|nr:hypothetical protein [Gammaproteobacteria bacterium]
MASRKKIKLCCDVTVRDVLCTAIREYAHAAYPEGGSECAQVARYTLLELAADIDAGITDDNETVEVSKRPRAMVKAALEYYFNRADEVQGLTSSHQRALFDGLLQEQKVTCSDLEAAMAADSHD